MKKIVFCLLSLVVFGCNDDFVNTKPLDQLAESTVWTDASLAEDFVSEIYAGFGNGGWRGLRARNVLKWRFWLGKKWHALEPKEQGMPMNSKHHGHGKQGVTPKRAANLLWRGGHQSATDAGLDQGAIGVIVVNSGHKPLRCRSHKAKAILACNLTKRRHMKYFVGKFGLTKLGLGQQIAMPLAKGVVNFGQDGGQ